MIAKGHREAVPPSRPGLSCHTRWVDHPDLVDQAALRRFVYTAALWRFAQIPATDVVDAAVQALVHGVESPSIVRIACLIEAEAESELGDHLNDLGDLGLDLLASGHADTEVMAAAALCRRHLRDGTDPQALTNRVHRIFGHDCHPLIEALSNLDDRFDILDYVPDPSRATLEADTQTAANNLVAEADRLLTRVLGQQQ